MQCCMKYLQLQLGRDVVRPLRPTCRTNYNNRFEPVPSSKKKAMKRQQQKPKKGRKSDKNLQDIIAMVINYYITKLFRLITIYLGQLGHKRT